VELVTKKKLHLLSGRAHLPLAEEIAEILGEELGEANLAEFANGEIHSKLGQNVRGADVFIIQSHSSVEDMSINDSIMEQLIMIDAARRASAKRVVAVCPFYGYARQDRKAEGREPITAKLVANMFTAAGADRLVSIDLHSGQIQGFFDGPVDHLQARPVLIDAMRGLGDDLVVVSPDAGRVKVAEQYANELHADLAIVHKRRVKGEKNAVEARDVVGDVDGRCCVLIDDMIDTAGTMVAAAEQLKSHGASEVHAACTHAVLSGPAVDRIKNSSIQRLIATNTLPLPPEKQFDKLEVHSIAPILAAAIDAVFEDTSVSELFGGRNQT
jgi:ribose-phosphate pyrophosphokinase